MLTVLVRDPPADIARSELGTSLSERWAGLALLLLLSACATPAPSPREPLVRNHKIANLWRAAALPWKDEGRCVVQEASHSWPVLVERCFQALDTRKIRFRDTERRCPVASADVATMPTLVSICLLTQPEIIVGAVIIIGVVVVAVAIKEELDAYALKGSHPEDVKPAPEMQPAPQEPVARQRPKPDESPWGEGWPPPPPTDPPERDRPVCTPRRVPPKGGNALHNKCADNVPFNTFRGANALVNGKAFDALQLAARTLWEIKTDNFDTYSLFLRKQVVERQVPELQRERDLASACGFEFQVGVRSTAHKEALEKLDNTLEIVVMDWC